MGRKGIRDPACWIELTCKHCGIVFEELLSRYKRTGKKYCSNKCYQEHREAIWVAIECEWCGTERVVRKLYVDRGQYRFCSDVCRHEARKRGLSDAELTRTCKACGSEFRIRPCEAESGKTRVHCSKECQKRREMLTCKECGKEYEHMTSAKQNKIFCSMSCYHRHRGETSIEAIVREYLEEKDIPFEPQVQFGRFTVDFVLTDINVILEADGEYWHSKSQEIIDRDARKESFLASLGFAVIRLKEKNIKNGAFREEMALCLN